MSLVIDVARQESKDSAFATAIKAWRKRSLGNYRLPAASITRRGEDSNRFGARNAHLGKYKLLLRLNRLGIK